jgi:ACT domain-containing protein
MSAVRTGRFYPQELLLVLIPIGARGGAVVEALHYKPKGRGIDSRLCHWNFSLT